MKRLLFPLIICCITLGIPRVLFATMTDEQLYDSDSAATASCRAETYSCSCTGTSTSTVSESAEATGSVGACDSFCKDMSASSYTYTCTLTDGTAGHQVAQGNVGSSQPTASTTPDAESAAPDFAKPNLLVPIPGFTELSDPILTRGGSIVSVNFLGEYISAVYKWIIGAGALAAVVLMMIGGLQYVLSRGKEKYITKAKARITNAITGLVLLLAAYNIAFLIDPATTDLTALQIQTVAGIEIAQETKGPEGEGTAGAAISTEGSGWQSLDAKYMAIVQAAKNDTQYACPITGDKPYWSSPTGRLPNQKDHHWYDRNANGDYHKIKALDFSAPWDSVFYAPIDGVARYSQGTKPPNGGGCGNMITLEGSGYRLTICHSKDFMTGDPAIDAQIVNTKTRTVKRGEPLGHVGAITCSSPTGNSNASPYQHVSLPGNCLPEVQSGRTTGAHVHMQVASGVSFLACFP